MTDRRLEAGAVAAVALMLVAASFIFLYAPTDALQGPVQRIFYLHVSSAIAAYGCFAVVLLGGIVYLVDVPVVHFSVTWWRTQHPGPVVINDALPSQMLVAFFVTMACTLFLAAVMVAIRYRIEVLTDQAAEKVVVAPIIASSEAGTAR